jgi:hypothetical protein
VTVVVVLSAKEDIAECVRWYERVRAGMGSKIIDEIEGISEYISQYPDLYQKRKSQLRVAPLSCVPYQIYYANIEGVSYVLGLIPSVIKPSRKQSLAVARLRDMMDRKH